MINETSCSNSLPKSEFFLIEQILPSTPFKNKWQNKEGCIYDTHTHIHDFELNVVAEEEEKEKKGWGTPPIHNALAACSQHAHTGQIWQLHDKWYRVFGTQIQSYGNSIVIIYGIR